MKTSYKAGIVASVLALTTGAAVTSAAAGTGASQAAAAARPTITSVAFSGYYGPGVNSPTLTISGSDFGSTPPAGTGDNVTPCGTFTANGQVYGSSLYFIDDNTFEAGHSDGTGADCVGISVVSWSPSQIVLKFGTAYASASHWYLDNGDGYALSLNGGLFGGTVGGLI